ncbi:hypothetical protein [Pseudoxanthomonas sp. CF125]|uniref:hypothetical protein n=1 Tax=Pseudoxanthomonas sp. CF125 TaxID=1855303 RepID=UPI00088BD94A|nr:hypothetical protein [Pseudoxanthomonas sp. CF125]SDQ42442.1 hypothetical protein SAMN05216569_1073 [Pseudoxanthomonas sp. CF125]
MTPSQILLTVKACILLALLGLAYYLGGASERADFADYRTKVMASTAKAAELATRASELVRKAEQAHGVAIAAVAEQYEQDKKTNDRKQADLVASLRAGNVRLHQRWQAALATSELSSAVKSASEPDAAARDREESAGRIVRAADEADAQIRGLQEVIRADRR